MNRRNRLKVLSIAALISLMLNLSLPFFYITANQTTVYALTAEQLAARKAARKAEEAEAAAEKQKKRDAEKRREEHIAEKEAAKAEASQPKIDWCDPNDSNLAATDKEGCQGAYWCTELAGANGCKQQRCTPQPDNRCLTKKQEEQLAANPLTCPAGQCMGRSSCFGEGAPDGAGRVCKSGNWVVETAGTTPPIPEAEVEPPATTTRYGYDARIQRLEQLTNVSQVATPVQNESQTQLSPSELAFLNSDCIYGYLPEAGRCRQENETAAWLERAAAWVNQSQARAAYNDGALQVALERAEAAGIDTSTPQGFTTALKGLRGDVNSQAILTLYNETPINDEQRDSLYQAKYEDLLAKAQECYTNPLQRSLPQCRQLLGQQTGSFNFTPAPLPWMPQQQTELALSPELEAQLRIQAQEEIDGILSIGSLSYTSSNNFSQSEAIDTLENATWQQVRDAIAAQPWYDQILANIVGVGNANPNYLCYQQYKRTHLNADPPSGTCENLAPNQYSQAEVAFLADTISGTHGNPDSFFGQASERLTGTEPGAQYSNWFQYEELEEIKAACGLVGYETNLTQAQKDCVTVRSIASKAHIDNLQDERWNELGLIVADVTLGFATSGLVSTITRGSSAFIRTGSQILTDVLIGGSTAPAWADLHTAEDLAAVEIATNLAETATSPEQQQNFNEMAAEMEQNYQANWDSEFYGGLFWNSVFAGGGNVLFPRINRLGSKVGSELYRAIIPDNILGSIDNAVNVPRIGGAELTPASAVEGVESFADDVIAAAVEPPKVETPSIVTSEAIPAASTVEQALGDVAAVTKPQQPSFLTRIFGSSEPSMRPLGGGETVSLRPGDELITGNNRVKFNQGDVVEVNGTRAIVGEDPVRITVSDSSPTTIRVIEPESGSVINEIAINPETVAITTTPSVLTKTREFLADLVPGQTTAPEPPPSITMRVNGEEIIINPETAALIDQRVQQISLLENTSGQDLNVTFIDNAGVERTITLDPQNLPEIIRANRPPLVAEAILPEEAVPPTTNQSQTPSLRNRLNQVVDGATETLTTARDGISGLIDDLPLIGKNAQAAREAARQAEAIAIQEVRNALTANRSALRSISDQGNLLRMAGASQADVIDFVNRQLSELLPENVAIPEQSVNDLLKETAGELAAAIETRFGQTVQTSTPRDVNRIISQANSPATNGKYVRYIAPEQLQSRGLGPVESVNVENATFHLSRPFTDGSGRMYAIGYVEINGEIHLRGFYKSQSQGVWRSASHLGESRPGRPWFGKGFGEDMMVLPPEIQQRLNLLGENPLRVKDSFPYFLSGLEEHLSQTPPPSFARDMSVREPLRLGDFAEELPGGWGDPGSWTWSRPEYAPDFSTIRRSFDLKACPNGICDNVTAFNVLSENQEISYTFFKDNDSGKVWLASAEVVSAPVNSYGIRTEGVELGDLAMPIWEYRKQVPARYQGEALGIDTYIDASKYTSALPINRQARAAIDSLLEPVIPPRATPIKPRIFDDTLGIVAPGFREGEPFGPGGWFDLDFRSPITRSADGNIDLQLPWTKNQDNVLELVINTTEEALLRWHPDQARVPGCRNDMCGLSSHLFQYAADVNGLKGKVYQVMDINIQRGVLIDNSARHAVTIVTDQNGKRYLVDLTFSQFIDPESGQIIPTNELSSQADVNHPLVQQLLERGYFELTDQNLNDYLNLLTVGDSLPPTSLDVFDQITPRTQDYSQEELNQLMPELAPRSKGRLFGPGGFFDTIFGKTATEVETASPPKNIIPEAEIETVILRLNSVETTTIKIGDIDLKIRQGFDPVRTGEQSLIFILEPGQTLPDNVQIIDKFGNVVDLNARITPLPVNNIDRIVIDGQNWTIARDAWEKPTLYQKIEKSEVSETSITTINKVADMWQAAAAGPEQLDAFLKTNLDAGIYQEIGQTLDYIKTHPEIQILGSREILDLWDLAKMSPELRLATLRKNLPLDFVARLDGTPSPSFVKLEEIIDKISQGQPFTADDIAFLNTWYNRDLVLRSGINSIGMNRVTNLNEQFVVANLAENALLRELTPADSFRVHQNQYDDFIATMRARGLEIPDWFGPYTGQEFVYGAKIDGVKANSGGKYFFSIYPDTAQEFAGIITHERVHIMQSLSADLGDNKLNEIMPRGTTPGEVYTETLAKLIENNGDVYAAIAANNLSQIRYKSGVAILLDIIRQIGETSGDNLLGTELMLRGILESATNQVNPRYGKLIPLENYFNQHLAQDQTLAEILEPFQGNSINIGNEKVPPNTEELFPNIKRVLSQIPVNDKNPFLESEKINALNNPLRLLSYYPNPDNLDFLLQQVLSDSAATTELNDLLNAYYLENVEIIRNSLPKNEEVSSPGWIRNTWNQIQDLFLELISFRLVKSAYAQEVETTNKVVPLSIYKPLARQALLQEALGQLPKEELTNNNVSKLMVGISQLMKRLPKNGQLEVTNTGVVVGMTGLSGQIGGQIDKGNYLVEVKPVPGVQLIVPQIWETNLENKGVLNIGVRENAEGVVDSNSWRFKLNGFITFLKDAVLDIFKAQAQENEFSKDPGVGAVQLYHDQNANGVREDYEPAVPWAGVEVKLTPTSPVIAYEINQGWNLIAFPFIPTSVKSAQEAVTDVIADGGYVTTIAYWDHDHWVEFSSLNGQIYGQDFTLKANTAYFIKASLPMVWTVTGEKVEGNPNINLNPGWNTLALPDNGDRVTADSLLNKINQLNCLPNQECLPQETADVAAAWDSGTWQVYVKRIYNPDNQENYGFDFNLTPTAGYMIRVKQGVTFD